MEISVLGFTFEFYQWILSFTRDLCIYKSIPENIANNAPTFAIHPFFRIGTFMSELHNLIMII